MIRGMVSVARKARKTTGTKASSGMAPATLAALALGGALIAVPTAGLAVTAIDVPMPHTVTSILPFTPANVDPVSARRVAAKIAARGQTMRFTPAGTDSHAPRTMTVAVRVDGGEARALSIRTALAQANAAAGTGPGIASIAPTRYNLGIARGYQSFAKPTPPAAGATAGLGIKPMELPDLASFRPSEGVRETPGRLQPRIALEQESRTGRAPRTLDGAGEQALDVGAGYRLSRNLNVTAGVRLSQDRSRLNPLTDSQQDSQAVYVGTQFRF